MSAARPAPTSIRLGDDLIAWLEGRAARASTGAGAGARARAELALWKDVLAEELRRQRWTLGEIGLVAELLHGSVPPDLIGTVVALEVLDGTSHVDNFYGDKWSVDEDALLGKLRRLGPAADLALLDAVARWRASETPTHSVAGWAEVGVTVDLPTIAQPPTGAAQVSVDFERISIETSLGSPHGT